MSDTAPEKAKEEDEKRATANESSEDTEVSASKEEVSESKEEMSKLDEELPESKEEVSESYEDTEVSESKEEVSESNDDAGPSTNSVRSLNFDPSMIHFACEENHLEENYGAIICTCEYFEEAHPLAAHLAPLYLGCNDDPQGVELMCACEEDGGIYEGERREYALHCCSCGVQLMPEEVDRHHREHHGNHHPELPPNHRETPPRQIPEDEEQPEDNNQVNPVPGRAVMPPPPPPPPALPVEHQPPERMLVHSTTMTPFTLLKALSCEDGSPFDTRLHEAARSGNFKKLRQLLEEDNLIRNINSKVKPFMSTPLREAVAGGCLECVRLLLAKGAEVDTVDIKGQTALFLASSLGYPATMEELLKKGANPEGSSLNSTCPLMLCVRDGCLEGVKVLLKYGVDPQPVSLATTCVPGWPLQHCVVYKNYRCFVALLRGGAETSLVRIIQNRMGLDPNDQEGLEPGTMQRLSITRTVLRHASDIPEFLLAYREFGGTFEGMQFLPEDMKNTETPALRALKFCFDNPCSLKSLSRLALFKQIGAKRLSEVCSSLYLPSSLSMYLRYEDLYDFKTF